MPPKIIANLSAMGFIPDYNANLYYPKNGDVGAHNKKTKKNRIVIRGAFTPIPDHAYYVKKTADNMYVVEARPMDEMRKKAMASRIANAKAKALKKAKLSAKKPKISAKKPKMSTR